MFTFSRTSEQRLIGVHPKMVAVVRRAMSMQIMDFSVSEGVRTLERQQKLFDAGKSKTMNSKHLVQSTGFGHAVDLYPSPIDMELVNQNNPKEIARFGVLSGIMRTCAKLEGVEIINGMDWDGDGENLDHNFFDAPHFELVGMI